MTAAINRLFWRLSIWLSYILEPGERVAVHGDLIESHATGRQAFVNFAGLVVRRQAALWRDWRPWLALVTVVAPFGMLLSLVSRLWADGLSVDSWVYLHHWDWSFFRYPGLRSDLAWLLIYIVRDYAGLFGWSLACGMVIGQLSRRATWANLTVFVLVLFAGTAGSSTTMRFNETGPSAAFSFTFYSLMLPIIVRMLFVVLPAVVGMRKGSRGEPASLRWTLLGMIALSVVTLLGARGIEGAASFFGWRPFGPLPNPGFDGRIGTDDDITDWKLRLLPVVIMWPAVFVLASVLSQRVRARRT